MDVPTEEAPVVGPQETVTKVVHKLRSAGVRHAVVARNGSFLGLITADALARHKIENPERTPIRKFVTRAELQEGLDTESAVHGLLVENQEAIAVRAGKAIRVVSKLGLLGAVKGAEQLRSARARDVMAFPYCVHEDETVAAALAMLRDMNVSRLPVVDERDRILGVVDTVDLLRSVPPERTTRGFLGSGERTGVTVRAFVHQGPVLAPDTPVRKLIEAMERMGKDYALVAEDGRIAGIVTAKRILKLLGERRAGVVVNVSGLQSEDSFVRGLVDKEIERSLRVVRRKLPVDQFVLHCRTYAHGGARREYEVKARLITGKGFFFAQKTAWDLTKAVQAALGSIEREVLSRTGKAARRRPGKR